MDAKKRKVIEVLKRNFGNVTVACEQVGINRTTFYRWKKESKVFCDEVENIDEYLLDFVENSLYKQIKEGNTAATIFYLKTKGKKRGYIEKTEIDHTSAGQPIILNLGSGVKSK